MPKRERGFFLLETLLTAFLLMTAVGFFSLYQHTEYLQSYREEKTVAEFFALREMALAENKANGGLAAEYRENNECMENNVHFSAETTVQATERENYKKVIVVVYWENHKQKQQVRLVKFIEEKG